MSVEFTQRFFFLKPSRYIHTYYIYVHYTVKYRYLYRGWIFCKGQEREIINTLIGVAAEKLVFYIQTCIIVVKDISWRLTKESTVMN